MLMKNKVANTIMVIHIEQIKIFQMIALSGYSITIYGVQWKGISNVKYCTRA